MKKDLWNKNISSELESLEDLEAYEEASGEEYEQQLIETHFSDISREEIVYNLEVDEQNTVDEAVVRLEQANLYNMLIRHNVFEGLDANPIALRNVQEELKGFIVDRLAVLLGMKKDKASSRSSIVEVALPFNQEELDILKELTLKISQGSSQNDPTQVVIQGQILESEEEEAQAPINMAPAPKINKLSKLPTISQKPQVATKKPAQTVKARQQSAPAKKQVAQANKITNVPGVKLDKEQLDALNKDINNSKKRRRSNSEELTEQEVQETLSRTKTQAISNNPHRIAMPTGRGLEAVQYQNAKVHESKLGVTGDISRGESNINDRT